MRMRRVSGSMCAIGLSICLLVAAITAHSDETTPRGDSGVKPTAFDNERLGRLLSRVDEAMTGEPGFWQLNVEGRPVLVVTDEAANRMRIISVQGRP